MLHIKAVTSRRLSRSLERKIGFMYRHTYNFTINQDENILQQLYKIIKIKKIKNKNWFLTVSASIGKAYLTQHCIHHHAKVHEEKTARNIVKDIVAGKNIIALSHKYQFNPLGLLKVYIENKGLSKSAFDHPPLKTPYQNAIKVDIFRPDPSILEKSQAYESHVQQWLDLHEIGYYTQEQLVVQQSRLTPDFLLKKPIMINDHLIHWIDAKNFYGATVPYIMTSLKKQAFKYNKAFGRGAFVFSIGYTQELTMPPYAIPDTLLLDDVVSWKIKYDRK